MKKTKQLSGTVFLISLVLLFATSRGYAAGEKKITIAYGSLGSLQTGNWMAKELRIYEKYGLETDLIYVSSGPVVMQALIGGNLQAGMAAASALIAASLRGAPLVAVLTNANTPYHKVFVQPEIKRIEDLRGKTLGVSRFGGLSDNLTRIFLRKYALEGATNIRQFGGIREVNSAFEHNAIHGLVADELRVDSNVQFHVLAKLEEMGIKHAMGVMAVTREFLQRNPQQVEAIVRSYVEGVAAVHSQKETARRVIAKYTRLTDSNQIEEVYRNAVTYIAKNPRVEPEAIQSHLEFLGKKDAKLEAITDNSILDRLIKEGFIDRLYTKR